MPSDRSTIRHRRTGELDTTVSRLTAAVRQAIDALDAEHRPDEWVITGNRGGCALCWPKDGSWPCTSRLVADDLRAALGDDEKPSLAQRHQEHYRSCNCLGDAAECCDPACECHNAEEAQP